MTPHLETKGYPLGVAPTYTRPPVARVAAEAASEAALREVSQELETLRAEGRVVLRLLIRCPHSVGGAQCLSR